MALRRQGPVRSTPAILLLPTLALFGVLTSAPARAQITTLEEAAPVVETLEPFPWLVIGATGFGGLHTYGMQEMNEAIELLNADITQPGVKMSTFSGGGSAGVGLRAILKERLVVEAAFERLFGSHEIGGITAKSKISVPADAYLVTLGWDLLKKRRVGFGVEAGAGYYDANGEQVLTETNLAEVESTLGTVRLDGTGTGVHVGAYLERGLSGHIWVNFFAGYRNARVKDLEITGLDRIREPDLQQSRSITLAVAECPDCPDADGDGIVDSVPEGAKVTLRGGGEELDWSGFMGRMALTWYLNAPEE
jgi:hypothetical protein